jgi:uncharacterized protein (TIGR02271 family)
VITQDQLREVTDMTAYDRDGDKIGKVGQVYSDDDTGNPTWITVQTGLFGTHESFVPLQGAELTGDRVVVSYQKAQVKDAPRVAQDNHLSREEEQQLYRHYGLDYGNSGPAHVGDINGGRDRDGDGVYDDVQDRAVGRDTSGTTTDDAMTRSEEQLRVGTETRESGRARLRKYVVTEQQQVTVPVSREELRIEREPVTDANRGRATDGPAISEEEHEVTLHEERPVVAKEAVPVERVRLGKQTITDQETVGGQVRKEEIDIDDSATRGR